MSNEKKEVKKVMRKRITIHNYLIICILAVLSIIIIASSSSLLEFFSSSSDTLGAAVSCPDYCENSDGSGYNPDVWGFSRFYKPHPRTKQCLIYTASEYCIDEKTVMEYDCKSSKAIQCSSGKICFEGVCTNSLCKSDAECDDSNECTLDLCYNSLYCTHEPLSKDCDDGLFCTIGDKCLSGVCSGTINSCDDSDNCTDDYCNETAKSCVHTFNSTRCPEPETCEIVFNYTIYNPEYKSTNLYDIIQDSDNNYVYTSSLSNQGTSSLLIAKIDENNNLIFSKIFNAPPNTYLHPYSDTLLQDNNGYVVIYSNVSSYSYCYIMKLDKSGSVVWNKKISSICSYLALVKNSENNYVVVFTTYNIMNISVYNDSGGLLLIKNYTFPSGANSILGLSTLTQLSDNNYVIVGSILNNTGSYGELLLLNRSFDIIKEKTSDNGSNCWAGVADSDMLHYYCSRKENNKIVLDSIMANNSLSTIKSFPVVESYINYVKAADFGHNNYVALVDTPSNKLLIRANGTDLLWSYTIPYLNPSMRDISKTNDNEVILAGYYYNSLDNGSIIKYDCNFR